MEGILDSAFCLGVASFGAGQVVREQGIVRIVRHFYLLQAGANHLLGIVLIAEGSRIGPRRPMQPEPRTFPEELHDTALDERLPALNQPGIEAVRPQREELLPRRIPSIS